MKRLLSVLTALTVIVACIPWVSGYVMLNSDAALPSAVDLQTTVHLPPIGNQGAVGCCASMAATYMQFTNAYSRYIHEIDPDITWEPRTGKAAYCFSPRFTYNLAGAGTAWVYEILKEQGTVPQTYSTFSGGVTGAAANNALANDWATLEGYWDVAQNYRIRNYDQVWINNECSFKVTTSAKGQALIERIKQSLNDGNVVVTGGYCDTWVKALVTISGTGTYGKSGEKAIPYSVGPLSGGHQVSIIGYDDNITCVVNGVTLKGAFKVANSWGTGWQNAGCIWMMYDAMNETSPYTALNVQNRVWTMDQVVFLDYKTDLNIGMPELTAKLTVNTTNRDGFSVTLTRTDIITGAVESYTPYMFSHKQQRPTSGLNFYGSSGSASGVLTLNYDNLVASMPDGQTTADYIWGLTVSSGSGSSATVQTVKLVKDGKTAYSISGLSDVVSDGTVKAYSLDELRGVTLDLPDGVTVVPQSGGFRGKEGEPFLFTLSIASGYRATAALRVMVGGETLVPSDNGIYSFILGRDNVITVSGVVPVSVKTISITSYNGTKNFENYYGEYVYIVQINNSLVVPELYDGSALGNGYRYTFRVTVEGTTYEFVPSSFYYFSASTLYRLPVSDQGWFPELEKTYNLKIEICKDGVPVFTDGSVSAFCGVEPFSSTCTSHTHSYTSDRYVTVEGSTCCTHGTGYRYCSHKNCTAVAAAELPLDESLHHFGSEAVVTKNATRTAKGELSHVCTECGETVVCGYFEAGICDTDGNGVVTVSDATLLLNFLSNTILESTLACDTDFDGDGLCTIKDVTYLLLVLDGTILL